MRGPLMAAIGSLLLMVGVTGLFMEMPVLGFGSVILGAFGMFVGAASDHI